MKAVVVIIVLVVIVTVVLLQRNQDTPKMKNSNDVNDAISLNDLTLEEKEENCSDGENFADDEDEDNPRYNYYYGDDSESSGSVAKVRGQSILKDPGRIKVSCVVCVVFVYNIVDCNLQNKPCIYMNNL